MNFKKIFLLTLLIATVLLIVAFLFTVALGYEKTISGLIGMLHFEKYSNQINLLISKNKFTYIQVLICFLIVILGIIIKYYETIFIKIAIYLQDLRHSFLKLIKNLFNGYQLFVILLPGLAIIYYAISLPISYDEAWTYINFTSRSMLASLSYYPAPNNHILHSLLTNISYFIFSSFPLLSLRLPTIIISLMTVIISINFLTKHYNQKISILVSGIFPVLFMSLYYGYMSRGYQLIMLFFILSLHFVFNIIKNSKERDWVWFTIFSILGFFTMPSYLYAFIILNFIILMMAFNKSILFKQVKSLFIVIAVVFVLYLPAIVVSGLNSLINNKFVAPISRDVVFSQLPDFLSESLTSIFGLNIYFLLFLIICSLFLLVKNKDWFHSKLFVVFLLFPPILLLTHSVIPFSRTFYYYGFILIYLFIYHFVSRLP